MSSVLYAPGISAEIVAQHGLTAEEYRRAVAILDRPPNITELGVFSVMWSEHCSYKSSKIHLKKLPTTGPRVICGPGENAGVVDIGDGQAVIFKMESHNHPSFIEPYQGAATGVGGILRDVFTMGARPIANLNALRFGSPDHPKTRHLISGVVAGIGGYGNCVGVPTVAGQTEFHPSYNGNILVNAMTVGLADADNIFYSAAAGPGNPVIYVGAKTGRDGIHGATMASAEFTEDSEAKRPTVQVGDPFTEKLLIEACLELMAGDAIVAIQDMGAAGLTSSSVEMAGKGGLGLELDLSSVPVRETAMQPYEIMLSESQERMLMILKPGREAEAQRVFEKWELAFAVIGTVTETGHLVLKMQGEIVADLPVEPLVSEAPQYDRPWERTPPAAEIDPLSLTAPSDIGSALKTLVGSPEFASKAWIWDQYDKTVMGDTIATSASDAAIVRVHGTRKGLALTTDCNPRYCMADPERGGAQAVAETWRNITATGALPLALTDNMNFGNPERRRIMGQFVLCIEGMRTACLALDYPVVSGNVSLYNETSGTGILPTPAIGGVGLIDDFAQAVTIPFKAAGESIVLIGQTAGHLGSSQYLRLIERREDGSPPPVDLAAERRNGDFVRGQILGGHVTACHDLSDGGLAMALVEMAISSGIGAAIETLPPGPSPLAIWFGEDQARYLLTTRDLASLVAAATAAAVPAFVLGTTGGMMVSGPALAPIAVADLKTLNESWMPAYMAGDTSRT